MAVIVSLRGFPAAMKVWYFIFMSGVKRMATIRFLNATEREVPAGDLILVLANYAAHKHQKVIDWLGRHSPFMFHITPISAPWVNAVEEFFAKLTKQRLARGVFHSLVSVRAANSRYVA